MRLFSNRKYQVICEVDFTDLIRVMISVKWSKELRNDLAADTRNPRISLENPK